MLNCEGAFSGSVVVAHAVAPTAPECHDAAGCGFDGPAPDARVCRHRVSCAHILCVVAALHVCVWGWLR